MKAIITLTLNPAIDGSPDAPRVLPTHKIRTTNSRYDPGGGGINVARVVQRLGGQVRAIYLAGGATGGVLDNLPDRDGIARIRFDIAGHTRISQAVHALETGRFLCTAGGTTQFWPAGHSRHVRGCAVTDFGGWRDISGQAEPRRT